MIKRPRRLRNSKAVRTLVRETNLRVDDLVYPLFVVPGKGIKEEISSLPENYHLSLDILLEEINKLVETGIRSVILFGVPAAEAEKDEKGSKAWADDGIVQKAIKMIKDKFPQLLVITDVCLCQYTSHGHCGIIKNGKIDNDATLPYLSKIALSHAEAGADMVAPSDMMDGRIKAIRETLDENNLTDVGIMSYSAKYNSSFYGPFREAAHSAPAFGDRSSYQMDPGNSREALKEVKLDIKEGADIVMVKPALSFLDIILKVKENTNIPVAAYSVSGEYSMIKNAASAGLCDEQSMMLEVITSIKRAGADIIITYFAKELAKIL
ncbi:MAG: porphobilinogen synthase [Bacillota bacterium]